MRIELKIVTLILSSVLVFIFLTACTGNPSSNSNVTNAPQGFGPPPSGQVPPSASSVPAGAPGNPSGSPAVKSSSNPQQGISLDQANTVVGSGTVTVENFANLYFGSAGRIASINVKQGDRVIKGAILAQLDTASLKSAVYQAQVNLDQARLAQVQNKLSLTQAQSALATAQFNLDKTNAVRDVKDDITDVEWSIKVAQENLKQALAIGDSASVSALNRNLGTYQQELIQLKTKLQTLLSQDTYSGSNALTYDIMGQKYDRLTVADVRMKQLAVESAQLSIDLAQQNLDKSQDAITMAQGNLDLAQQQLDQATIKAPFEGLVATINQNAGDFVSAPSQLQNPIIYLIDLNSTEIKINVNELDIPSVKIGKKANVNINSFSNKKLDGQVTAISPVSGAQGGVVNYAVTIIFTVPAGMDVRVGMKGSASISIN